MADTESLQELRVKKIGILIYDARLSSQKSIDECAKGMGVSIEQYTSYENGTRAPSLPEIESLAYYLNIPLEHFWGQSLISENIITYDNSVKEQLQKIRHKMIGTQLRLKRDEAGISTAQICEKLNIEEETLEQYENGDIPIPLTVLEVLAKKLQLEINLLFDKNGPIGNWRNQQTLVDRFLLLPAESQQFICNPENLPYIKLAILFSTLPKESWDKLHEIMDEISISQS